MTARDLRSADELLRNFSGKALKSACYAPFVSLYLNTTGEVLACCRNQTYVLGDLRAQRLREIWNGGRIKTLRQALAGYKFGLGCSYCEWESQRRSDSFAIRLMSDHLPVLSPEPEWPAMIEFNASNTCNLECIMCCGENSSSIRGNQQGLPPMPKVFDERFFQDLRPFLPHLHFINFLGGEPFLSSEVHRVWDIMREDGLQVPCRVTTNGTQYNDKVERAIHAIPMHVTVSLDGVTKDTYENVRHRSNFETVIANLHRFHAYTRERGTNFGIAYCLMRQNWREVGEIALSAEQLDCELSINMVAGPSHCTLFTLPPAELRAIVDAIAKIGESIAPRLKRHRKAWEETIMHLRAATDSAQLVKIQTVAAWESKQDTEVGRADRHARRGAWDEARRELNAVRKGHIDYYFAVALSGYVRSRQGDLEGAERDLDEALRISRKLPEAYLHLGRLRFRQGRFQDALENARLAVERVTPEATVEAQALVLLGLIYARRWRLLRAYRLFLRLAALPAPSFEGVAIPDSKSGARQCLEQTGGSDTQPEFCGLALRLHAIYRLANASRKATGRLRAARFARSIARWRPTVPAGEAAASLASRGVPPSRWSLRVAGVGNRARLEHSADRSECVRVDIEKAASGVTYDVQLNYMGVEFRAGRSYHVKFGVRSDQPRTVGFGIAQAGSPWSNLGLYRELHVDAEWREIHEQFIPVAAQGYARLHFDLGASGASFEIDSLRLTER